MLTLAIETSNPSNSAAVALGRLPAPADLPGGLFHDAEPDVLGVEPLRPASRHEDDLLPAIARLCERAAVAPRQLQQVAVSVGPGGYTSLRIAVAAAKMIAAAVGARTVSVPTATAVARAMRAQLSTRAPFAVALAGKQDSVHLTTFTSRSAPATPDDVEPDAGRLIDANDIPAIAAAQLQVLIADRFIPEPIRAAAAHANIEILEPVFDPAAVLACAALAGRFGVRAVDPVALLPLYGRDPEAVRLWKERASGGGANNP